MLFGVNTFNIHSDYFRKQAAQLAYVISLGALNAIDDSRLLLAHSRHYPAYSTCSVATLCNTLTNVRYPRYAHPPGVNFLHRHSGHGTRSNQKHK